MALKENSCTSMHAIQSKLETEKSQLDSQIEEYTRVVENLQTKFQGLGLERELALKENACTSADFQARGTKEPSSSSWFCSYFFVRVMSFLPVSQRHSVLGIFLGAYVVLVYHRCVNARNVCRVSNIVLP